MPLDNVDFVPPVPDPLIGESIARLEAAIKELRDIQKRSERERLIRIEDKLDRLLLRTDPNPDLSTTGEEALKKVQASTTHAQTETGQAQTEIDKLSGH